MFASIDNLKLGTKSLLPVIALAILFVGVLGLCVDKMNALTAGYEDLTERADQAVIKTLRVNRRLLQVSQTAHYALNYDTQSPVVQSALKQFAGLDASIGQFFEEASQLDPANAAVYRGFRERVAAICAAAKAPLAIAAATPGLDQGPALKPEDLAQMAKASKLLYSIDEKSDALVKEISAFNENRLKEVKASVAVNSLAIVAP